MARSRNIKPSIMENEELADLDPIARLLFIYLWMLADREGRLEDRPKRIAGRALPYDRDANVDELLQQLAAAGFITRYTVGDLAIIQINNFTKHQSPHVRESAASRRRSGKPGRASSSRTASALSAPIRSRRCNSLPVGRGSSRLIRCWSR